MGKNIIGSWGGNSNLDKDLKFFARKISNLNFNLSKNISKFYNINNINKAFLDLKNGKVIRPIIKF
jgi:Zn-dependent alcohol dehydrogenase